MTEKPRITVVRDNLGMVFEAFELRGPGDLPLYVGAAFAEKAGGIEVVRRNLAPHFWIVAEKLT